MMAIEHSFCRPVIVHVNGVDAVQAKVDPGQPYVAVHDLNPLTFQVGLGLAATHLGTA